MLSFLYTFESYFYYVCKNVEKNTQFNYAFKSKRRISSSKLKTIKFC